MIATDTTFLPAPRAGVSLNYTRSSAEWYELNNELFTVRGKHPHPDNGDPGSGLQAEIAELQSVAKDERSTGQRTRLRRLEYELENVNEQIFDLNFGLVRSYVKRFAQQASRDNIQDFEAAGALGLMKAIDSYDPSRGLFTSWAYKPILREVHRAVRDANHPNINPADFGPRPKVLAAKLELQNGNESFQPRAHDIAVKAGVTVGQVNRIIDAPRLDSLSAPTGDGTAVLADFIEDQGYSLEDRVITSMAVSDMITYKFSPLDEYLGHVLPGTPGLTVGVYQSLSSIGEQMGLSREAVHQIECKTKDRLLHPVILRKMLFAGTREGTHCDH
jgi:DNA-directed RNA polymerase sigma subunit (sigma70/sigma32)